MLTNPPGVAGDGSGRHELALCRKCATALEHTPDAIGRLRERCPKCDGIAPIRKNGLTPAIPQEHRLTNDPAAERLVRLEAEVVAQRRRIAELELDRDRLDYLLSHRAVRYGAFVLRKRQEIDTMIEENANAPRDRDGKHARTRTRVYAQKTCPCGVVFTPTGPRSEYHAKDCPARTAAKLEGTP